jgi:chemotaxis protein MotB
MIPTLIAIAVLTMAGCVSSGSHKQTVEELEQMREACAKTTADFDTYRKQSTATIAGLEEEQTKLSNELLAAQTSATKVQRDLEQTRSSLDATLASRNTMEEEARKIRAETSEMERLNGELRRERDLLQSKADDLQRSRDTGKQEFETQLKAEQATSAGLQHDKQLLMAKTAAATDELARAQKRLGELEADASRVNDLERRLSQREIEVGRLAQGGETLAAEKERLEKERAAQEMEIQRLTETQEDLTRSLQAQIAKGDIKIKQVRDRLTINMVEKVLFNSGQAQVKLEGLKVLKQVADVLKTVNDKQIRIEGHTDNVPIGGKLKEKFPTNWELSTARATNVVRYFIEQGGVNRENLEAVGYADTRPVADNETDAGRTENRRIEIVLFPKDLKAIAGEINP